MTNLKEQLIRLGSTNPDLREHIRPVLEELDRGRQANTRGASHRKVADSWTKLWRKENNRGMGFDPRGGDDINNLRGVGKLLRSSGSTDQVAVYDYGDTYILVGDSNGPWAVQVAKDEVKNPRFSSKRQAMLMRAIGQHPRAMGGASFGDIILNPEEAERKRRRGSRSRTASFEFGGTLYNRARDAVDAALEWYYYDYPAMLDKSDRELARDLKSEPEGRDLTVNTSSGIKPAFRVVDFLEGRV